ncbi:MAG: hypothetical protein GWO38_10145 [Phycisphaerae bacterium]|nr:hypothetical protein [Phycisphaerae bacterium]NIX27971.1 hypothetical protein [Phycisphaerae bacterium]
MLVSQKRTATHLEHHLYPAVPSHNYGRIAQRLEPYLRKAGVEPVKTI